MKTVNIRFNHDAHPLYGVDWATSYFQRLIGLLGTRSGELVLSLTGESVKKKGMLISPCSQIHTFGMNYPIDVVFISNDLQVLKVVEKLLPNRVAGHRKAKYVLEIATGSVEKYNIKLQDQLVVEFLE